VIGANVGCKLFVALQLELRIISSKDVPVGEQQEGSNRRRIRSNQTQKIAVAHPFQSSVSGRPGAGVGHSCGIHFECLLRNIRDILLPLCL